MHVYDIGGYKLLVSISIYAATHIDSGSRFLLSKNISITVPIFVEYDTLVFAQPRVNVTLRCVPNDTRSQVVWSM